MPVREGSPLLPGAAIELAVMVDGVSGGLAEKTSVVPVATPLELRILVLCLVAIPESSLRVCPSVTLVGWVGGVLTVPLTDALLGVAISVFADEAADVGDCELVTWKPWLS